MLHMNFLKPWMGVAFLSVTLANAQQQGVFVNDADLDFALEASIDAEVFVNKGVIDYAGFPPVLGFDTQNTRYYTNSGYMNHPAGFVFETIDSQGLRTPAKVFFNDVYGVIGSSFPPYGFDAATTNIEYYSDNRIDINAETVVHQGLLSVGSSGLISIHGDNLNLRDGGLMTETVNADAFDTVSFGTNFIPSTGVFDNYWGGLTNAQMDSTGLLNVSGTAANVISPRHLVTNASGFPSGQVLSLQGANFSIVSNALTETNIIVQAVFTSMGPGIDTQIRFTPSPITNEISTAIVELTTTLPNPVTGSEDLASIYLTDTLAWETNLVFEANLLSGTTQKPSTYNVYRNAPAEWLAGAPGTGELSPDLLYNSTFTNTTVTNFYSAYSAYIAPSSDRAQFDAFSQVPQAAYAGGGVEISGQTVDISHARWKASAVDLKADHFINDGSAVIHAAHMNYALSSTNSVLDFEGLAPAYVPTFAGDIKAFSAIWTNQSGIVVTNPPADENSEETYTTNVVEYYYHVLMLDGVSGAGEGPLSNTEESLIHQLDLSAPDRVEVGTANVDENFQVDAPALLIKGDLNLSGRIQELTPGDLPNTHTVEIDGSLAVNESIRLGTQEGQSLDSFVNRGNVFAFSQAYKADYFENRGEIIAGSSVSIEAGTVKLQGGRIGGRTVTLEADHLKMHATSIPAADRFIVHGSFIDSGDSSGNLVTVNNGFEILGKAETGDLLGTELVSNLPWWAEVSHVWAGEDLGKSTTGFSNNAALGKLTLNGIASTSRARFSPSGNQAALYVDYLEFSGEFAAKWRQNLKIDPGFKLYFGGSNVPVEELDGAFDGRLNWVAGYAGPRSGVAYTRPDGSQERVNQARIASLTIDDDGDGVVNGFDVTPFEGVVLSGITVDRSAQMSVHIAWTAGANSVFRVEFKDDVFDEDWQLLTVVSNTSEEALTLTASDTEATDGNNRFYRVVYLPAAE